VVRHGTLCQRRSESAEIWRWRGSGYPGWLIHGSGSRPLAHSPWIWFPRRTAWMGFWRWVWFPEPSGSERPDGVTSPPRCGRTTVPPRRRSPGRWRNGLGFRAIAKAITPAFRLSIAGAGRGVQSSVAGAGPSRTATGCSTAPGASGWWSSAAAVTGANATARRTVPRGSAGGASATRAGDTSGRPWGRATTPPARNAGDCDLYLP